MQIDRRKFTTGAVVALANSSPAPQAFAAITGVSAPTLLASGDLATVDPWLVQIRAGAPRLVIHEASGAMFRSRAGVTDFAFERLWTNYAPPYGIFGSRPGWPSRAGEEALVQLPVPERRPAPAAESELSRIAAAVPAVLALCAAQSALADAWLQLRPKARTGEASVMPARIWGARADCAFPEELCAVVSGGASV